jgi:alkylation response protein AidB-like acyl-CoA dehydrogenase
MKDVPYFGPTDWPAVLREIRQRAGDYERDFRWPSLDLQALAACGALRWAVSRDHGGDDLPALDLHLKYEELARASLATALILTQRDSAVGLIDGATNGPNRSVMLNRFAKATYWVTVGIAQLTTSRQGGPPALRAEEVDGGYRLNGVIPWCTGAQITPFIVAGAVLPDGKQILFILEQHAQGVTIEDAMDLVALRSTLTNSLKLKDVNLADPWVLTGPVDKALAKRKKHLELGQAFLGTGLSAAALDLITDHRSDAARDAGKRFTDQLTALRDEMLALSQAGREPQAAEAAPRIRGAVNDLAIRVTHAAVALYKGTALLSTHPAQRLAREAMFLLVWSCPNPVIDCTVDVLARGKT